MSDNYPLQTWGEDVQIGTLRSRTRGAVQRTLVNVYGAKTNSGDPGPDDHPTDSTWIQRDWIGGLGTMHINPASDTTTFWFSDCDTEHTHVVTNNVLTTDVLPDDVDNPAPTGEFWAHGDRLDLFYGSWGASLYSFDPPSTWTLIGSIASTPVSKGTVWVVPIGANAGQTVLAIPRGGAYSFYNGIAISNVATSAEDFAVWDHKLFRLDSNGEVFWMADSAGSWTSVGRIPGAETGKHLVPFLDRSDLDALYVVTDGNLYVLDFDAVGTASSLRRLDVTFPRVKHQGEAAIVWRSELYWSVGLGVNWYKNGVVRAVGPDGRDGLPVEYAGHIEDMTPAYNHYYALIHGEPVSGSVVADDSTLELGGGDDQMYASEETSSNLLLKWNASGGWHHAWEGTGDHPTSVVTSVAGDEYRLWWGTGDIAHWQQLSTVYFNPRFDDSIPTKRHCRHETGEHTWGMLGQLKIGKIIEINLEGMQDNSVPPVSLGNSVKVEYMTDRTNNTWVAAGTFTTDGEHHIYLGEDGDLPSDAAGNSGLPRYKGLPHEWFRLAFELDANPNDFTVKPKLTWHAVVARKFLRPKWTYNMVLDVTENQNGWTPGEVVTYLESLVREPSATLFLHNDVWRSVEIVGITSQEIPGEVKKSFVRVNLIDTFEIF